MGYLSDEFMRIIRKIGLDDLARPVFYDSPIGIRFEISGNQSFYLDNGNSDEAETNPEFLSAALSRVKVIYQSMPQKADILRIDLYPDEENDLKKLVEHICDLIGVPQPHEQILYNYKNDDEIIPQLQLYWDLSIITFSEEKLFSEIIKADIDGCAALSSSVYLVNRKNEILFYLYDSRGLDVVASDKEVLRPMYKTLQNWILEYDREKINKEFKK